VRKQTLSRSERALAAIDEHEKILDAIRNRDEELADKLSHEHIVNTITNLRSRGLLK
jgi:DNA-binding GntR family transcriptional regulator